jgi:hypothetical protein
VRDGIALAKMGVPALAFVTDGFWTQGDFVAAASGMPDIPRLRLPHPVAGSGKAAMTALAQKIREEVLTRLSRP